MLWAVDKLYCPASLFISLMEVAVGEPKSQLISYFQVVFKNIIIEFNVINLMNVFKYFREVNHVRSYWQNSLLHHEVKGQVTGTKCEIKFGEKCIDSRFWLIAYWQSTK